MSDLVLAKAGWTFPKNKRDGIYPLAEAFCQDPIRFLEVHANVTDFPWTSADIPPIQWSRKPIKKYLNDEQDRYVSIDKAHLFWKDRRIADLVWMDSEDQFELLQQAFKHVGIDFRIGTRFQRGDDGQYAHRLDSITVTLPADPHDQHNSRGHTVTVNIDQAKIKCGYVEDDLNWQEYEKRKAANWLADFEEETIAQSTYEDYEYKPDQ